MGERKQQKKACDKYKKEGEKKVGMKSFNLSLPFHFKKLLSSSWGPRTGQGELGFILGWTNLKTLETYLTREEGINYFESKHVR